VHVLCSHSADLFTCDRSRKQLTWHRGRQQLADNSPLAPGGSCLPLRHQKRLPNAGLTCKCRSSTCSAKLARPAAGDQQSINTRIYIRCAGDQSTTQLIMDINQQCCNKVNLRGTAAAEPSWCNIAVPLPAACAAFWCMCCGGVGAGGGLTCPTRPACHLQVLVPADGTCSLPEAAKDHPSGWQVHTSRKG